MKLVFQCFAYLSKIATKIESAYYANHRRKAQEGLDAFLDVRQLHEVPGGLAAAGFKWKEDPISGLLDYTSEPWVTWHRKTEDCDGWARLYLHAARKNEVPAFCLSMLRMWPYPKGHAVCVVFTRDSAPMFNVMSNLEYDTSSYISEVAIADAYVPDWTHAFKYDENMTIEKVIRRPAVPTDPSTSASG